MNIDFDKLMLRHVTSWSQRVEPKPGTLIYSNPESNEWGLQPGKINGFYLGNNLVALIRTDCVMCRGYGRIPNSDPTGDPKIWVMCPECHGSGNAK